MSEQQRRLVLLRHAKSDWGEDVSDRDRPLTARGRRNASTAGRWLREHLDHLDAVACSPARRAQETWALASAELTDPPQPVLDEEIYGASPHALVAVVAGLPDDAGTALLVGHNPGMQDVVELLSGERVEMKAASVAVLTWTGDWTDAGARTASLQEHATPRD